MRFINRVTGQEPAKPCQESDKWFNKKSILDRVLGEAKDGSESESKAKDAEDAEPSKDSEGTEAAKFDEHVENEAGSSDAGEDTLAGVLDTDDTGPMDEEVKQLVATWQGGSKMDVADRLLNTPVSYVTFVKTLFQIGEDEGVELGNLLDQLADYPNTAPSRSGKPTNGEEDSYSGDTDGKLSLGAKRILSKVSKRHQMSAGETSPDLDSKP